MKLYCKIEFHSFEDNLAYNGTLHFDYKSAIYLPVDLLNIKQIMFFGGTRCVELTGNK